MHQLDPLTKSLHSIGCRTHIETSGAGTLSGNWDWITCSPKKFKPAELPVLQIADELKVIIYHKSDLEWALGFIGFLKPNSNLLLQPEWSKKDEMIPLIIEFVKEHPIWRISLQTHKWIGVD
jgi:organic radical activating enzyme